MDTKKIQPKSIGETKMYSKEKINQMIEDQLKDMDADDRARFYETMMEKCCENMPEDKTEKIKSSWQGAAPKSSHPMMGMMTAMMQGRRGAGSRMTMMRDMCSGMMTDNKPSESETIFGTAELKDLFNDWLELLIAEVRNYMKESGKKSVEDIAQHFNLSNASAEYIIQKSESKK